MNVEWLKDVLGQCERLGYRTTPVYASGATKPYADGQDYKDLASYRDAVHIGLVLDDLILVDYDGNKTDGIMPVDDLAEELDEFLGMPEPVQAKGQSLHWWYKKPEGVVTRSSADGFWLGIDIKTNNQLMHIKEGKALALVARDDVSLAPDVLLNALHKDDVPVVIDGEFTDDGLDALDSMIGHGGMSEDRVRELVSQLDHNMPNDQWVKVGQALHHWHPVDGLTIWEEWSKGGYTYEEGECAKRWKSFKSGGGVTMGTVVHMAKSVAIEDDDVKVNKLIERINMADRKTITLDIAKDIQSHAFDNIALVQLAGAIQKRLSALTGTRVPIKDARDLITKKVVRKSVEGAPGWCADWIYIDKQGEFYHKLSRSLKSTTTFNMSCGRYVPEGESGGKPSAMKYVSDNGYVEIVDTITYLPNFDGLVCEVNGQLRVNTFDHEALPKVATNYSEEGLKAIELVKAHVKRICNNNDEYYSVLMQWLAWQVQHKGQKLLWAPVIQSIEGVGKSWFQKLLGEMIGMNNVKIISPGEVTNSFNGWAIGSCVNILNEIYITGHNRYEAVNAIKPLITDSAIMINDKGIKQYQAINVTNYICFTNYKNAIPMGADSRRWWVIFVEIDDLEKMGSELGMSKIGYFDAIFDALTFHGDEVLKFFSEYTITDEFKALKQAPDTIYKAAVVATEKAAGVEGLEEAEELLNNPKSNKYSSEFVSTYHFFNDLDGELYGTGVELAPRAKSKLLERLGFSRAPKFNKRDDGHKTTLWVKNPSEADQYAKILEEAIGESDMPF